MDERQAPNVSAGKAAEESENLIRILAISGPLRCHGSVTRRHRSGLALTFVNLAVQISSAKTYLYEANQWLLYNAWCWSHVFYFLAYIRRPSSRHLARTWIDFPNSSRINPTLQVNKISISTYWLVWHTYLRPLSSVILSVMDATKLDYTLTNPHSPRYTPTTMVKNQERQIFFSVSAMSSHLDPNSFDLARNFGPLPVAQLTEPPYHYHGPCDIVSSPDQHRGPFPQSQEAPLTDVTPYIYDSGYPSNPQESQSSYHLPSGHEAFHVNVNEDLSAHSVSLSLNSSLGPAIQTPTTAFSSVPSNYSAVRRYHEDQSRQHAQVLQQLTRSRDGRRQSSTEHANGNGVLSASLEITPTGRRAEFYHAASSIPMSNIRLHQPRPPEHASHQLQHAQQSKSFNQYQYPYYHNQALGYSDNCRSEPLDGSGTHVLTTQGIGIYESAQQQPTFPLPAKAVRIPSPSTTNSTTIALESSVYTTRSGPLSNAMRLISRPSIHSFDETTGTSKVHPTTSVTDIAPITTPPLFPALKNGTGHEDAPSGIVEEVSNLIEIESEDEEKFASERIPSKEDGGAENIVRAKRRDRKQSEGSGATGRRRTADPKNNSIIKDGLSPPSKKRKKSKMHECQVCQKNFPRPSGLKTHMNTHNNERPYPCPFPGCNRSFGVRSNAKRHLRTHGVIPPQNTGTQPYVVDFSTPMVLEQDDRLGLNGEGTGSCNEDDDLLEGDHSQGPGRPSRGRGRQFKLRWMPPSSSTKSGAVKGKGKKRPTNSPSVEPVEMQDHVHVKPSFSRSPSQRNVFLSHGEEDQEEEDADGNTDGEEDTEMDFADEGDDQDEDSEVEDVDRSEEEFGASTAMRAGVARFHPSSSQHSQASSSRTSLSSSLSMSVSASAGSTSATSLPLSASSSSFTSVSPIRAEYFVDSGA